jgi:hypothetical protein
MSDSGSSSGGSSAPFGRATERLSIGSKDNSDLSVEAQYNPKELQVDRSIPWQKHNQANKSNQAKKSGEQGIHLEFTGAEGRTMSVELLFDQYEGTSGGSHDMKGGKTIIDQINTLEQLASVINPTGKEEERRPHLCVVAWGQKGMPTFRCVIESLSTKYTMIGSDGTPLRATCTVKLKEADVVTVAKKQ